MAGLTDTGFTRLRLEDIKANLEAAFIEAYGEVNTEANSMIGILIGILSSREATLWEELENAFYSQYPASAEGFNLDNVTAFAGVSRLVADNTEVLVALWGDEATDILIGFQGSTTGAGDLFSLIENIIIDRDAAAGAEIEVNSELTATYTLTVNGTGYDFVASGHTKTQIATGLASSIDTGENPYVEASSDGAIITIVSEDGETEFTLGATNPAHFDENQLASFGHFEADETGAIVCPIETLITIETAVGGLNSIINYNAESLLGRDNETDTELRIRLIDSFSLVGTCTIDAIRAALLQNVSGVTAVHIEENNTDAAVGGLPAHSFECFVEGGAPQDIADEIWRLKPAGIATHGDNSVNVTDSEGITHAIEYSEPTEVLVWIDINMTENTEEGYPTDGDDLVEAAVLAYAASLSIGDDVIIGKLEATIYNACQGIATIVTTHESGGAGPHSPPLPDSGNIAIAVDELAAFDAARIWVTMA